VNGRDRLLAACAGRRVDATPVWFMRQAGGRLPVHLALRERHSVMEIAKSPQLCAEVTVGAADALGVDGAILYADIMLLVEAMGVELELTPAGPVLARPIRAADDVAALREVDPATDLGFVLEAIGRVQRELAGRAAVIGIAGGPFTLAAYLVEGAPSRDQLRARAVMHGEPGVWRALLERLTTATIAYVRAQAAAGADVVQLFDTWAGSLTPEEYRQHVAPFAARILAAAAADVPTVHHVAPSGRLLGEVAAAGGSVVGVDSRQGIGAARRLLADRPVQGNLDPALVLVGSRAARTAAAHILDEAGSIGHVFNLGEATPRDADPAVLRDLATFVHERSAVLQPASHEVPVRA
jgi:uroporphyrinogen decarboxylase